MFLIGTTNRSIVDRYEDKSIESIDFSLLSFSVCEEEEAEEPIERRIHQSDEYYQEKVRSRRFASNSESLRDPPKYDIDE
jgi:hypothetical protein